MSFPLTRQIYRAVTESARACQTLQIIPDADSIVVADDAANDVCEIGIPKQVYLALFSEGHKYLRERESARGRQTDGHESGDSLYFATIAILLTTNEYSTVWRLHERCLAEMCGRDPKWLMADYKYMVALATSRLDRINKSSMLWHFLRKSAVRVAFLSPEELDHFLSHVMRSMSMHFANYSAGYTYWWAVQMAQVGGFCFDQKRALLLVQTACRASLGDISLWTLYGKLLLKPDSFAVKLYNDAALAAGVLPLLERECKPFVAQETALDELRWLLKIDCQVPLPYVQVLQYLSEAALSLLGRDYGRLERILKSSNQGREV